MASQFEPYPLDALDRRLIGMTQSGLPLEASPYATVAAALEVSEQEVLQRLDILQQQGVIRRIGAVVNHYALGYVANGMSVWDLADAQVDAAGQRIGALSFVTHCYRRPRHGVDWPYNLFAMVHGSSRDQVYEQVSTIRALLEQDYGTALRGHEILFSTAILKKTGLRLPQSGGSRQIANAD